MPCYRCGARQHDPARGPSEWARGVRGGEQVLVCPTCRPGLRPGDLDACPRCGSERLSRVLGDTACRGCGLVVEHRAPDPPRPAEPSSLSAEVDAALRRVLNRPDEATR